MGSRSMPRISFPMYCRCRTIAVRLVSRRASTMASYSGLGQVEGLQIQLFQPDELLAHGLRLVRVTLALALAGAIVVIVTLEIVVFVGHVLLASISPG